jgi:poly(3-hydroxybutyrate) depolymerase
VTREFIAALPDNYDPGTPHRLVFAFHGLTGTASQIAGGFGGGFYGLESRMDNTVFVAPQGLGTDEDPGATGWPNNDGRDIAFVEAMLDFLESNYCIDSARIFSIGFSYGGIMSNTIACQLGSRFRAVAPMAGALFSFGQNSCVDEPVAAWFAHGSEDMDITLDQGETARDALLDSNGCDTSSEPVAAEPSPCVAYQGCADGYPVHWCVYDAGHVLPDFAPEGAAAFFSSF